MGALGEAGNVPEMKIGRGKDLLRVSERDWEGLGVAKSMGVLGNKSNIDGEMSLI